MTIDNHENLIINIGDKTQLFNKEFVKQALKAHTIEKENQTFCAQYNREQENIETEEIKAIKIKKVSPVGMFKEENKIEPNYYMKYKIIPLDFILANNIPFVEANVIKYVCRWKDKNGVEDLRKAVSYLEKLIKYEENGTK